jgi:hypothetical protein
MLWRMIPKSMPTDLIRGLTDFSDRIMRPE